MKTLNAIAIIIFQSLVNRLNFSSASSSSLRRRNLSPTSDLPSPSFLSNASASSNRNICRVSVVDIEGEDDDECLVCDIVTDNIVSDYFLRLAYIPEDVIELNEDKLTNHSWFIEYSVDQIERKAGEQHQHHQEQKHDHLGNLYFTNSEDVITVSPSEAEHIIDYSIANRNRKLVVEQVQQKQEQVQQHDRKLRTMGEKTLIVVLVGNVNTTEHDVHNYIFGETNSLASQLDGCSHGQMTIVPHPEHPILRVNDTDNTMSQYSFLELYRNFIVPSAREQMNLTWRQPLPIVSHYYLIIVPDDIKRNPHEVAWGALNGYYFGVMDSWVDSTQTLLHEMGHNFGNAHAFEKDIEYADTTTVMGYSQRGVSKVCFNGQHIWHMGWFEDRRKEIALSSLLNNHNHGDNIPDENLNTTVPTQMFPLAFYGDYSKTSSDQPVVIRVGHNIFLTFNRKKNINEDTNEYGDMLLIIQQERGRWGIPHSNLLQALSSPTTTTSLAAETMAIIIDNNSNSSNSNTTIKTINDNSSSSSSNSSNTNTNTSSSNSSSSSSSSSSSNNNNNNNWIRHGWYTRKSGNNQVTEDITNDKGENNIDDSNNAVDNNDENNNNNENDNRIRSFWVRNPHRNRNLNNQDIKKNENQFILENKLQNGKNFDVIIEVCGYEKSESDENPDFLLVAMVSRIRNNGNNNNNLHNSNDRPFSICGEG